MLRSAEDLLENSMTKRNRPNDFVATPELVMPLSTTSAESRAIQVNPKKTKSSLVIEQGQEKKIKIQKQLICCGKRKGDDLEYDREKEFDNPQTILNNLVAKVFNDSGEICINQAQTLLIFLQSYSLAGLDLNVIVNGASIFLHIIASAKNNGTLGPLVLNKICAENLLNHIDWNCVGTHPLCKGETPLVVLCKGLYDKALCNKVIDLLLQCVPEIKLENESRYLIHNKRITPLRYLKAQKEQQAQQEFNSFIKRISNMKI